MFVTQGGNKFKTRGCIQNFSVVAHKIETAWLAQLEVFNTVITLDIYQFTIPQVRIFLGVLILLFVSISMSKPFVVLEVSNFIVSVNSLLNETATLVGH